MILIVKSKSAFLIKNYQQKLVTVAHSCYLSSWELEAFFKFKTTARISDKTLSTNSNKGIHSKNAEIGDVQTMLKCYLCLGGIGVGTETM